MSIICFTDEYRFLSNFYPCVVVLDGVSYSSVEHAYQAAKTLDLKKRQEFQNIKSFQAKKLGRQLVIRNDWEAVKLDVMKNLLEQKFAAGTELRTQLDTTCGMVLVEGNYWHDNFWGSCTCKRCNKKGTNHLGKLLMTIRGT